MRLPSASLQKHVIGGLVNSVCAPLRHAALTHVKYDLQFPSTRGISPCRSWLSMQASSKRNVLGAHSDGFRASINTTGANVDFAIAAEMPCRGSSSVASTYCWVCDAVGRVLIDSQAGYATAATMTPTVSVPSKGAPSCGRCIGR